MPQLAPIQPTHPARYLVHVHRRGWCDYEAVVIRGRHLIGEGRRTSAHAALADAVWHARRRRTAGAFALLGGERRVETREVRRG